MAWEKIQGELSGLDILVLVLYFVVVLIIGLLSSLWSVRSSMSGYFLASRSMNWILVGASLFASNIGSGHFVGLAGSGAVAGIAVGGFELNAIFILIFLGWLFVPVYIASGVFTMPEYLKRRFGGRRIRVCLAVFALLLYILTKISADLFAGAIFVKTSLDISLYPSIGILLIIACILTVAGGLTAVIWTDAVQVLIMLIGAVILMVISFERVGGYQELVTKYFMSNPAANVLYQNGSDPNCAGLPRKDALSMLRDPTTGDLPWPGMIFGLTISSVWYWCADQVIVQRALSAKNYSHAKGGCVLAGWLKFLPIWLLIFPGMAARVLYPNEVGCTDSKVCEDICENKLGCSNIAYPLMVTRLLPGGLRGLMLACMLSALMSSLTSVFNSSSTIFTVDIWPLFRKNATEVELLIVGRLFVIVLMVIGILWIPIINAFPDSQLFNYIQSVTSYLSPPICAVYVLAIFVPRVTEAGAFWGLFIGLLVGITRFILEISYQSPRCFEPDTRPDILTGMHYLYFGILLFFISLLVTIVVSLMTEPINEKHLQRLTFWTRFSEQDNISISGDSLMDQITSHPPGSVPQNIPGWRKVFNFICGVNQGQKELSEAEKQNLQKKMISIEEKPFWKHFWNVNAILVMTVAVFLWVFYA